MNRIKLSIIAERFPEIGVYLADDKENETRKWVVLQSLGKPLYDGKIPLSNGKSSFVDVALDGDTFVYVPQYDYRKYISPTYKGIIGRPKKNESERVIDARRSFGFKVDFDVNDFLFSHSNMGVYINSLIRKDMEKQMKLKEQED